MWHFKNIVRVFTIYDGVIFITQLLLKKKSGERGEEGERTGIAAIARE
jgi:hypothetical protein